MTRFIFVLANRLFGHYLGFTFAVHQLDFSTHYGTVGINYRAVYPGPLHVFLSDEDSTIVLRRLPINFPLIVCLLPKFPVPIRPLVAYGLGHSDFFCSPAVELSADDSCDMKTEISVFTFGERRLPEQL